MFRFKLGVAVGFGLGWLVVSGKAAELIEQFRRRRDGSAIARAAGTGSTGTAAGHATPIANGTDDSHIYDFATRAAE